MLSFYQYKNPKSRQILHTAPLSHTATHLSLKLKKLGGKKLKQDLFFSLLGFWPTGCRCWWDCNRKPKASDWHVLVCLKEFRVPRHSVLLWPCEDEQSVHQDAGGCVSVTLTLAESRVGVSLARHAATNSSCPSVRSSRLSWNRINIQITRRQKVRRRGGGKDLLSYPQVVHVQNRHVYVHETKRCP